MVGHTTLGAQKSHLIPPIFLHGVEGFSLPGTVPPNDMVNYESVFGVKLCDGDCISSLCIYSHLVGTSFSYLITHLH